MKMELKSLIDNPLTPEEETALNGFFDSLADNPKQKIVVTLENDERPALAKRKLSYLAEKRGMPIHIRRNGVQITARLAATEKRPPRLTRADVEAKVLAFLKTRPNTPLAKTLIATGAGLTMRQTGKALQTFLADNRVTTGGEPGKETFIYTPGSGE